MLFESADAAVRPSFRRASWPRSRRAKTRAWYRTSAPARRPGLPRAGRRGDHAAQELGATGSFLKEDRPRALDLLGFESQLVFNTFVNQPLLAAERARRPRLRLRRGARPQPRDGRLLRRRPPAARDRLRAAADFARAARSRARRSPRAQGAAGAVGLPARPRPEPRGPVPGLGQAAEAGLPIVFHVGGGAAADDRLLDRDYFENGVPPVPDFHGGAENFRSVDYMAIPTRRCRRSPR